MRPFTLCCSLSESGSISGSKLLCCPVASHEREATQNMDIITLCALAIKQLRCIATGGKFTKRLNDLATFSDDANRSLAAHRARLL